MKKIGSLGFAVKGAGFGDIYHGISKRAKKLLIITV
jgi:hypothetical protein